MTETNDFLPAGYKIPTTSKYFKFQEGLNTFRILDKAIVGMEFWQTKEDGGKKPIRRRMDEKILDSELQWRVNPATGEKEKEKAKHFWAMPIWNYNTQLIQILEINQKGILESIKAFQDNPKWGNPVNYDITITKTGNGKESKYITDHDPKEELNKGIAEEYKSMFINLEALFTGEDPFAKNELVEEAKKLPKESKAEVAEEMPF